MCNVLDFKSQTLLILLSKKKPKTQIILLSHIKDEQTAIHEKHVEFSQWHRASERLYLQTNS